MAYALRSRINQWNIIKWQGFSKSKGKVIWKTRKAAEWKKIFQNPTYDRGIIYKMDKELKKLDSKENTNPIKNEAKQLSAEEIV